MKLNSGDLKELLENWNDDPDFSKEGTIVDDFSELESYEPAKVNRTKLHQQDRHEINSKAKGRHYRESSKRNWSE